MATEAEKFVDVDPWEFMMRRVSQEGANYNPVGGTGERACSNCQFFIPPGGCSVVQDFPDAIVGNGLSDLWRARERMENEPLEVVIVGGSGHLDDEDKELDAATKQETKTEGGVEYKASDYASVPDSDSPSTWKLRLAEGSSGNFTVAQVGRAVTALQPGGFRGNEVQLSSSERSSAITKIGGAIGSLDATDDQKSNLRERLDDVKEVGILIRVAKAAKEKVLKALGRIDEPEGVPDGPFTLTKDRNDQYRWTAIVTNNYRDRDNPPEIFEEKAHKEFRDYLNGGGKWPELWMHHVKARWGVADWVSYSDGGMMAYSGTVDEGMESVAEAVEEASKSMPMGVSHGYEYLHSDKEHGIIGWYRTFEISPLPLSKAANVYTGFSLKDKEGAEMPLETEDKIKLGDMGLAPEVIAVLEGNADRLAEAAQVAGVESKEATDAPETPDGKPLEAIKGFLGSEAFKVSLGEALKPLTESIGTMETEILALKATEDSKVAAVLAGAVQNPNAYVASRSSTTALKDGDPLKDAEPGVDLITTIVDELVERHG